MGECRGGGGGGDYLIKLFGKTIPVPEAGGDAKFQDDLQHSGSSNSSTESDAQEEMENTHQDTPDMSPQPESEVVDADDPKSSPEAGQREKLKKPDKVLPCPRCSSMDTKFCYFNNYNVNQPRHFCKNCQRYWTAGGAMRNVPVGAGRRKNKSAAATSHFLQRVRAALPAGGDPLKANGGTVLSFGQGAPPAALDLAEQVGHLNGMLLVPARSAAANPSAGSGISEESSTRDDDNQGGASTKEKATAEKPANGVVQHPAIMNGAAVWPYGCAPSPAYYSSGIAIPIYPAAPGYWGCMVPGAWSVPWPVRSPSQGLSSPTSTAPSVSSSGPDSLALGKHPREGDEGRGHGGAKVWAPKTIRIDDADEVARSSIWSLIGVRGGDRKDADKQLGTTTVFEPRRGEAKTVKQAMITSSPLLHANPVALTRSVTFQEGS